jgi:hypothetical protein
MAPVGLRYDITLDFDEASVPVPDYADYIAAAARWEQIVIGDVEDVPISELAGFPPDVPGCTYPTTTGFIDDMYMCVHYQPLTNGIIGLGGYIYTRPNGLPVSGFARIDPNAIAHARQFGYFNDLILHEFGHAIGIGTAGACPSDNINSMANLEYQDISGCTTAVPINSPGCGHYAEDCLGAELMTPVAAIGDNPISRITVGWLDDLGYEVNYSQADPFDSTMLGTTAGCNCKRRNRSLFHKKKRSGYRNVRYVGQQQPYSNDTKITERQTQLLSGIPKLSSAGYNIALQSGSTYLNEQRMKRDTLMLQQRNITNSNSTGNFLSPTLIYVGDQFVWIYILENSNVYSVLVQP